jgi:hypothetical protein
MHLLIRRYRPSDAARCCEIILACLPQLDGIDDDARAFLRAKLVPEQLNTELSAVDCFVAVDNGEILGLAALDGDTAKRLYVDPTAQRHGVGFTTDNSVEFQRGSATFRVLRIRKSL